MMSPWKDGTFSETHGAKDFEKSECALSLPKFFGIVRCLWMGWAEDVKNFCVVVDKPLRCRLYLLRLI